MLLQMSVSQEKLVMYNVFEEFNDYILRVSEVG